MIVFRCTRCVMSAYEYRYSMYRCLCMYESVIGLVEFCWYCCCYCVWVLMASSFKIKSHLSTLWHILRMCVCYAIQTVCQCICWKLSRKKRTIKHFATDIYHSDKKTYKLIVVFSMHRYLEIYRKLKTR